jgi:hypothetical protein
LLTSRFSLSSDDTAAFVWRVSGVEPSGGYAMRHRSQHESNSVKRDLTVGLRCFRSDISCRLSARSLKLEATLLIVYICLFGVVSFLTEVR